MKIPFNYYLEYWLKITFIPLVLILLLPPLYFVLFLMPWILFIILLICQIYIYRSFVGDRRTDFEYSYKESMIEKLIRKVIRKKYGGFVLLRYFSSQLSQFTTFNEKYILSILHDKDRPADDNYEFAIYMKLAELSMKNGNFAKNKNYLEKALEKKPLNLLAHYKIAICFEGLGDGISAIEHYKSALQDPDDRSDELKELINKQILFVSTSGPRKRPPMPGLRFITW